MTRLHALYVTLKARGLGKTLAILLVYVADYTFDIRYGTDTRSWTSLDDLSIDSENKQRGEMYQPTLALPLERLFRELNLPASSVLVDLGCGKGRVLLVAAKAGLKTMRGVEFSPELCRIARRNCDLYTAKTQGAATFEIIEGDVVNYEVRQDDNVFFLYNPFDGEILSYVLDTIRASQRVYPRPMWIIYRNAVHGAIIDNDPVFEKQREHVIWGLDFAVYQIKGLRT
jgi:SAM-dependent methyltransferase